MDKYMSLVDYNITYFVPVDSRSEDQNAINAYESSNQRPAFLYAWVVLLYICQHVLYEQRLRKGGKNKD